jgi:hypothetical protein
VDAKDLPKLCKGLGEAAGYDQVLHAFRDGRPANPTQATLEDFIKVPRERVCVWALYCLRLSGSWWVSCEGGSLRNQS